MPNGIDITQVRQVNVAAGLMMTPRPDPWLGASGTAAG
jgi:hypothetical protein